MSENQVNAIAKIGSEENLEFRTKYAGGNDDAGIHMFEVTLSRLKVNEDKTTVTKLVQVIGVGESPASAQNDGIETAVKLLGL